MLKSRFSAIVAVAALLSFGASAATVTSESGTVLVNTGSGFVPVIGSVEVSPGARVMVQPGGSGTITYPNNVTVRIAPGQIWEVQTIPPDAAASSSAGDSTLGQITSQLADNSALLLAGGVVLGGGIALAISFKPASP